MKEKKRVFILGAGASKHCTRNLELPIPLAREFFQSKYVNKLWPNNHLKRACFANTELLKFISSFFNAKSKRQFKKGKYELDINEQINIEEVFSLLEFIEAGDYYFDDEIFIVKKAKHELIEYLIYALGEFHFTEVDAFLYQTILKYLTDRDSIITYNWDCIIETQLIQNKKGKKLLSNLENLINPYNKINKPDFEQTSFEDYHKSYFLKLHGSLNWYYCKNVTCPRHNIPAVFDFEKEIFALLWSCDFCGNSLELMILPPHVHKSYRNNRFFSLQAKVASQKLSLADELIIIGYSFPEFDFEANALFKRAIIDYEEISWYPSSKTITIVNPEVKSKQFVSRVKRIFSIDRSKYSCKLKLYASVDDFIKKFEWIEK